MSENPEQPKNLDADISSTSSIEFPTEPDWLEIDRICDLYSTGQWFIIYRPEEKY